MLLNRWVTTGVIINSLCPPLWSIVPHIINANWQLQLFCLGLNLIKTWAEVKFEWESGPAAQTESGSKKIKLRNYEIS